jgi:ribosomal protein S13
MKKGTAPGLRRKSVPKLTNQQLGYLRGVLHEIAENYVARLEREIQSNATRIDEAAKAGTLTNKQLESLEEILELIQQTPLKPEKGRRKDLKRVDQLIGSITDTVETW